MRHRIFVLIAIVQSILFLGHWFLYETWSFFVLSPASPWRQPLAIALFLLSLTFVGATLLAMRSAAKSVRLIYTAAAVWAGMLSFFVLAACACWVVDGLCVLLALPFAPRPAAEILLALAAAVGLYGVVNAAATRVKRITVPLRNLPASWHGRRLVLVSDLHLGHVRGENFARKISARIASLDPEAVLIAGDLYDGTAADANRLAAPLGRLRPPLGCYYIAGNHEEFRGHTPYLEAVARAGIRVLDNEKIDFDGLQLVGVHHRDSTRPDRYRSLLQNAALNPACASLLLTHAPNHLAVPAETGVSFTVCGHTHAGQLFPFRWLPRRVYGRYVYGLNTCDEMFVYTSSGAGTWGPPLRVGTTPEIVLIRLETATAAPSGSP